MAKLDELKEEIGWLKVLFGIFVAIDVSLLGWLAQNYDKAEFVLLSSALVMVSLLTIGTVVVNRKAYQKMKEIGDL